MIDSIETTKITNCDIVFVDQNDVSMKIIERK